MGKAPIDLKVQGIEPARAFEHELSALRAKVRELQEQNADLGAQLDGLEAKHEGYRNAAKDHEDVFIRLAGGRLTVAADLLRRTLETGLGKVYPDLEKAIREWQGEVIDDARFQAAIADLADLREKLAVATDASLKAYQDGCRVANDRIRDDQKLAEVLQGRIDTAAAENVLLTERLRCQTARADRMEKDWLEARALASTWKERAEDAGWLGLDLDEGEG